MARIGLQRHKREKKYDHLNQQNILIPEQNGFRTKSSTEKASYNLLHEILLAMNSKITVRGTFCDLQKAFDYANHNILLEKLKFYGVKSTFYTLVKSYLEGRYQTFIPAYSTSNYNTSSSLREMKHGVPQDCILGPLFF